MSTAHNTLVRRRVEGSHKRKRDVIAHLLATASLSLFRTGKAMIAWIILAFKQVGRRMNRSRVSPNGMRSARPAPAPGEAGSENPCIGYLGYPFQNKQGKSCVENFARDVEKEEKIRVVVIITSLF